MKYQNPLISIITINKDNLIGLKKTFESLRSQIKKNFEWIVIDGNSTDGSINFIHDHFKFIQQLMIEDDKGIYDAHNKGIRKSSGEYLIFLNSGDTFYSADVTKRFEEESFTEDIVYGDIMMISQKGSEKRVYPPFIDFDFFSKEFLCHQAVLIHRRVFDKLGFFAIKYKFCSDQHFFYRIWKVKSFIKRHFPILLVNYDMEGFSSKPKNQRKLTKEIFYIRMREFPIYWKFNFLFYSIRLKFNSLWN